MTLMLGEKTKKSRCCSRVQQFAHRHQPANQNLPCRMEFSSVKVRNDDDELLDEKHLVQRKHSIGTGCSLIAVVSRRRKKIVDVSLPAVVFMIR